MHDVKHGLVPALILLLLVPGLFFAAALSAHPLGIPTIYGGIFQDAVALVGVWLFNRFVTHVPVKFWNGRHAAQQLQHSLPAMVIIGLLVYANVVRLLAGPFLPQIFIYLGYILLIGLTEEYIFRGTFIPLLARAFPGHNLLVVLLSSLLFGGLHLMNITHLSLTYVLPQILFAMAIGTFFAGIYISTRNLMIPILLHAATDLSVVVQFTQHPTSSANLNFSPQIALSVSLFYGVVFLIALLVTARQVRHVTIATHR
ncbi:CPBP family intramembrane glutamic endopeptidase [Lactiplantibacillus plajomi]|uniref:CPBP family intramembrane glutamic endopeptidase n=1 Tax=Lactiplantibacillus plajomi TaxID=1457217 RepID=A0ABV6K5K9_9LACO|nr:CPBP family intramembrane glutamic endopeptidase [Lactiplantibacillus plajomi]